MPTAAVFCRHYAIFADAAIYFDAAAFIRCRCRRRRYAAAAADGQQQQA